MERVDSLSSPHGWERNRALPGRKAREQTDEAPGTQPDPCQSLRWRAGWLDPKRCLQASSSWKSKPCEIKWWSGGGTGFRVRSFNVSTGRNNWGEPHSFQPRDSSAFGIDRATMSEQPAKRGRQKPICRLCQRTATHGAFKNCLASPAPLVTAVSLGRPCS